jgi:putative ABC transport system permease protein
MHWMRRWYWRLEVLFRKERAEEEMDEELAHHLELEIRENIRQGMPPDEARRKALVAFGGLERTRERVRDSRGARRFDDLLQDLRYSLRRMAGSPAFYVPVVLTLAIGIGTTMAMFSILDAALFRALPYPDPDRLVLGRTTFNGTVNRFASFPDYLDYRDGSDGFEALAAFIPQAQRPAVLGSGEPVIADASIITADFFRALGVDAEEGRTFTPDEVEPDAPEVAVISHGFWQRQFGGAPEVVGASLTVAGSPVTVVGIMPPDFRFYQDTDLWLPVRYGILATRERRSHSWQAVGRLKEGVTRAQAQAQLDVISARLAETYPETHTGKSFLLTPLGEALAEGYRSSLLVMMGATLLLLLIACGNVAGLLMARATTRRGELSIRTALGASRPRLMSQLFTEHGLLAVISGGLGALLALWLQRLILTLYPLDVLGIVQVGLSLPMLSFTLLVSLGTALLFGAGPALIAARADPSEELRSSHRSSSDGRGAFIRGGLVVAQVALSVVLLSGSGLLIRSLLRLRAVELGFQAGDLITARLTIAPEKYENPQSRADFLQAVQEDVGHLPGVVSAAFVDKLPIRQRYTNWTFWNPEAPPDTSTGMASAYARFVLPGYFEAMGVPIRQGRDHDGRYVEDPRPPVILNQVAADYLFPDQDPIGHRMGVNFLMQGEREFEVIGVVGDMRITAVNAPPGPQMYFSYHALPYNSSCLVVRTTGQTAGLVPAIRRKIQEQDPVAVLSDVMTMTDIVSASLTGDRVLGLAVTFFALSALLLTMMGLYAVLAYHVMQRIHEIGIRMVYGATEHCIMGAVLRQGLLLVAAGLVIGFGGALSLMRLIRAQLYEVGAADPMTFGCVALAFLLVGVLASLVPARRASRVDPVRALQVR